MSMRLLCLGLTVALLAGCATRLPRTSFAEPAALDRAMTAYYDAHATEEHGYCLTPYIDGLTHIDVVENQPDKLVVDVRYLYRDRSKYQGAQNPSAPSGTHSTTHDECTNFAGRQFTFGKGKSGEVEVLDMTGPRRS
jgi:uncharacterized protein YceK